MKLKAIAVKEPVERMTVSLKQSTVVLLEQYRAHYKAVYGNDVENSTLVEGILRDYIESDKDYQKARAKVKVAEPAVPAVAPVAASAAATPASTPASDSKPAALTPPSPSAGSTSSTSGVPPVSAPASPSYGTGTGTGGFSRT